MVKGIIVPKYMQTHIFISVADKCFCCQIRMSCDFLHPRNLSKLFSCVQVRINLFGPKEATYSGYTCYTGIADFVPVDIETVGYVQLCLST